MSIRINWDRVKELHSELESGGCQPTDKLMFIIIESNGKPKKAMISFQEIYSFFWSLIDNDAFQVLTFVIQDVDGRILYRHKQLAGNEEIPNGGQSNVIAHWPALTDSEKQTYVTILAAQIEAYER